MDIIVNTELALMRKLENQNAQAAKTTGEMFLEALNRDTAISFFSCCGAYVNSAMGAKQ